MTATELTIGQAVTEVDNTEYAAPCPHCGELAKAKAAYLQATRTKPCTFLGFTGYCRHGNENAMMADGFNTEAVQLVIA